MKNEKITKLPLQYQDIFFKIIQNYEIESSKKFIDKFINVYSQFSGYLLVQFLEFLTSLILSQDPSTNFFVQLIYFLLKLIQVIESDLDLAEYGIKRHKSENSTKYKLYYKINDNTFELLVPKLNDFTTISSKISKRLMTTPSKLKFCFQGQDVQFFF
jgi:hypothetical protein